jgi:hypothetical protein
MVKQGSPEGEWLEPGFFSLNEIEERPLLIKKHINNLFTQLV